MKVSTKLHKHQDSASIQYVGLCFLLWRAIFLSVSNFFFQNLSHMSNSFFALIFSSLRQLLPFTNQLLIIPLICSTHTCDAPTVLPSAACDVPQADLICNAILTLLSGSAETRDQFPSCLHHTILLTTYRCQLMSCPVKCKHTVFDHDRQQWPALATLQLLEFRSSVWVHQPEHICQHQVMSTYMCTWWLALLYCTCEQPLLWSTACSQAITNQTCTRQAWVWQTCRGPAIVRLVSASCQHLLLPTHLQPNYDEKTDLSNSITKVHSSALDWESCHRYFRYSIAVLGSLVHLLFLQAGNLISHRILILSFVAVPNGWISTLIDEKQKKRLDASHLAILPVGHSIWH